MRQITPSEMLEQSEKGVIVGIFSIGRRVYGFDPRGLANDPEGRRYELVWADVP